MALLGAAALDAYEVEPLPSHHPHRDLPNVIPLLDVVDKTPCF